MIQEFSTSNKDAAYSGVSTNNSKKNIDPRDIFNTFLQKKRIFKNKEALSSAFVPGEILHRDIEIEELSNILAPSLLLERVSNILVYGFSGTGKSLVTRHVAQSLSVTAAEKKRNSNASLYKL